MNRNIALVLVLFATAGCKKHLDAAAIEKSAAAIVQQSDRGTSTWIVGPDGAVSALLKDPSGNPIKGTVTGQVTFQNPDGTPQSVPVQFDPSNGVVTAAGPKLTADVTPVDYSLTVDGKPWTGSLSVPVNGTQELADNAKLNVASPPPTTGPHGGVVQLVGPDRVELVANKGNGEVRAYMLDPTTNQPIDPGERKVTIALQGDQPETVVLAPDPTAHYVVGHVRTRVDPVNVTVVVNHHGHAHGCLVGWAPGAVVVVGPAAPRVHLLAVETWPGEVVEVHGHGHHGEVVVGAPGVVVGAPGVVVGAPGVVVGAPGVVVGGPRVIVGGPGVVVGGPGHVNIHENIHVGGHGGHGH